MKDESIVRGVIKREVTALDGLIRKYGNLVHYIVYSVLDVQHYRDSTDECVNDIYFAVWNNMDCYDPTKSSLKNWLASVAKYKAIDYRRKLQKRYGREIYELENMELPYNEDAFETAGDSDFYRLLDGLNDRERLAVIKRYLEGHEITEIAVDTGVSPTAVYKRLSRGREKIRKNIVDRTEACGND